MYRFKVVLGLYFMLLVFSSNIYGSVGTGWPLEDGYVVTNYHVVEDAKVVRLFTIDGVEIVAHVWIQDKANDLALLRVSDKAILPPALPIASELRGLGAEVFTIGFPHIDFMGKSPKLTTGTISSVSGYEDDPRFFQVSVPVQPGNSGGPLIDRNGEVVGVITSKLSEAYSYVKTGDFTQNVNYALKAPYVRALLSASPIKSNDKIDVLESRNASMEVLAQRITPSILIVLADSQPTAEYSKDKAENRSYRPQVTDNKNYTLRNLGQGLKKSFKYKYSELRSKRINAIVTLLGIIEPFSIFMWGTSAAPEGHLLHNTMFYTVAYEAEGSRRSKPEYVYIVTHVSMDGRILKIEKK